MIRELKTFEVTCDRCRKSVTVMASRDHQAREKVKFEQVAVHGCGMTDYTRYDDVCPECAKKESDGG